MNKIQKTYMIAKALYTTAAIEKANLLKPYDYLLDGDDAAIEEYTNYEIKFNEQLKCDEYRKALRTAEDAMIKWANNKVKRSNHFNAQYAATMNEVMSNIHLPSVRNRMVEIAFRLA